MQCRIVADPRGGAEPGGVVRRALLRQEPAARVQRPHLDRILPPREEIPELLRHLIRDGEAQLALRLQRFGCRHLGHRVLVVQAVLGRLERGGHRQDRLALLHRHHPARREALAVEVARHLVHDREILVARSHEIGVERMRVFALDRSLRRLQRLRDHLPAEHPTAAAGLAGAAIQIGIERLDVEQRDEHRRQLFGRALAMLDYGLVAHQ